MIKVKRIINSCTACPTQWEGVTDDNCQMHVRYRWGHFDFDGSMDYQTLKDLTKDVVEFPESESYGN